MLAELLMKTEEAYKFCFDETVSLNDALESLFLAIFSSEGIHGRAQVRLTRVCDRRGAAHVDRRRR